MQRLWEIDVLRGIAVVAMVPYHFSYDLAYFGLFGVGFFRSGLGLETGRAIGTSFIFLAGLSLALSYQRALVRQPSGRELFRKYLGRGVRIFSYGLLITFLTWIFVTWVFLPERMIMLGVLHLEGVGAGEMVLRVPEGIILFGVLHLIGASIVLAYPFLGLRLPNVALGAGCIAIGLYLRNFGAGHPWLAWLGVRPDFFMLDYWPIFPWFGVVLLGIFAGNALYGGRRKRTTRAAAPLPGIRPLAFLGRHSLPVYLVHQPILLATLILLGVGDVSIL